jgi:hypothetical protein
MMNLISITQVCGFLLPARSRLTATTGPPGTLYVPSPTEFPGYRDGMVDSARLSLLQRPFFDGDRPIHPGRYEDVLLPGDIVRVVVTFGALILDSGMVSLPRSHLRQLLMTKLLFSTDSPSSSNSASWTWIGTTLVTLKQCPESRLRTKPMLSLLVLDL